MWKHILKLHSDDNSSYLLCSLFNCTIILHFWGKRELQGVKHLVLFHFMTFHSFPKQPHWMLTCSLEATIQSVTRDGAAVRRSGARVRSPLPVIGSHLWSAFTDGLWGWITSASICLQDPAVRLYSNSINLNIILSRDIKVWVLEMNLNLISFWDGLTVLPWLIGCHGVDLFSYVVHITGNICMMSVPLWLGGRRAWL